MLEVPDWEIEILDDEDPNVVSVDIGEDELDILVGWSGFSKKCFLNAAKYNCIKILERGSSHIKFQEEILKNEVKKEQDERY